MSTPTELIGSIARAQGLVEGMQAFGAGQIEQQEMDALFRTALADTIQRFEATGSPAIADGELTKPSFATYPVHGLTNLATLPTDVVFGPYNLWLPAITWSSDQGTDHPCDQPEDSSTGRCAVGQSVLP
ncbi:MAG: hypothetical protein GWN58_31070 [Anaerolineae bacterium]|nr:hypothetical protein [Anaerolineae bacterium]